MVNLEGDRGNVSYGGSRFHFLRFGIGTKVLIAFHGFGLDKESFLSVSDKLGSEYTIYSFDLFFHGQSYWAHKDQALEKNEFTQIMHLFLSFFQIDKFSIITYSLGGKFGLCMAEAFTERLDKLIMVASDGIVISPWYRIATGSIWTRSILKYIVFKPALYFRFSKFLNFLGIIPNATVRFAELNMFTKSLRLKVYFSWVVFRKLKLDMLNLCNLLNENEVQVELYFGSKDFLIPMKAILKESSNLTYRKVKLFNCSHSKVLLEYSKD